MEYENYVVREGDTIISLALRFDMPCDLGRVHNFLRVNRLSESSILAPGKVLRVKAAKDEVKKPQTLLPDANQDVMCQELKKSASYCTSEGRVKGALTITPYFVCFEVESEKCMVKRADESKVEDSHSRFMCYIDMHDVLQCKYVVERSKHFMHLFVALRAVDSILVKVAFRLSKKKDVFDDFLTPEKLAEESMALCKSILEFRDMAIGGEPMGKTVVPFYEEFSHEQTSTTPSSADLLLHNPDTEGWFTDSDDEIPSEEGSGHLLPSLSISDSPLFHGAIKKKILSIQSNILTEKMFQQLRKELPKLFQLRNWKLVYSPTEHGCSLRTMYRNACDYGSTLLIISDSESTVFGGFVSEPWRVTKKFYGTGESFLFTFKGGTLRVFHPTLLNEYYIISDLQAIIFGAGVNSGLYIASDMVRGSSAYCDTYGNSDLAATEDFRIVDMELWSFV